MPKASQAEIDALREWFGRREAARKPRPSWRRVVAGYQVLVNNCCDPDSDTLAWKPGYAPSDTDRFRKALERLRAMPVSDRIWSNVHLIVNNALNPTDTP